MFEKYVSPSLLINLPCHLEEVINSYKITCHGYWVNLRCSCHTLRPSSYLS